MPEDLKTTDQPEEEADFELATPHEDIAAAYNALSAVGDIDTALESKADVRRIKAIKRMSLKIIHEQIKYVHDCIFSEEDVEEND